LTALPSGWAEARLDELAEVRLGRQRSPKNHTGVRMRPYLRAANVTWKGVDLADVKEMNFSENESDTYELRPGDVLVAEASGSVSEVGRPALWRGEIDGCCFQNTLVRIRSRGPLPDYLHYFLLGEARSGRIGDAAPGVGIHHIGATRLSAWRVAVPPLNEQRRIVATIEEVFSRLEAADESTRRAAKRLPQLRASILTELFSGDWPSAPLASITDPERPIRYGILMPKEHIPDGVLYIRVKDFPDGKIVMEGLRRTSPEIAAKYKRATLRTGDVLVSIRGTYGRIAIVPHELEGGNITQDTARISPLPHLESRYVAAYLRSDPAQAYFQRVARGVAVKGVNIGDLRAMPVPVPPLDEQHRILTEVEQQLSVIDAMREAIEKAERRSAALRRSILDRAFRGELLPQDPEDEPASLLLERLAADRVVIAPKRRASVRG
jgi:type I restriction enzyme, S subunit